MSPATPVPPDSTLESPFEEMALVRGGWLWRQSSILRRWKRNWFALWLDGTLGYYHDETAQDEEDRVLIHFNVRDIKVGQECHDVQPPEGRSRDGLLTVNLREGSRLHLCAETRDDAIAWKTALMEANSTPAPAGATVPPRSRRVCPKVRCTTLSWKPCKVERRIWVRVYSPYQDYYEVVPPNAHEATYVRSYYGPPYAGPGVTHVIVREDPCYSAGAPLAMGMLAGAATGAALGSLMWSPCWF
ncbi:pleckstrin homology domain-containing family B member 1-like isoform 1 [Cricetulus griseus]|uniref:Pleckstrin homology domain containing, family B (evectins) member 1 n=2 Tax=Cricetulus griseus TaxID=10029 RepID=A0A8C2MTS1_CRIGR|nr:pleckstrin homology domain-containing family B member 1-like isoform 1 [Cricetulus griseus]